MKYIFFAILGIVAFCIIKVVMSIFKGKRYWDYCERKFDELLAQGYSRRNALIKISKERHPELNNAVHEKLVDKCPDVTRLVNFIYNALEMGQIWEKTHKKKLTNEEAQALIKFTTVSEGGKVNTDYTAVKEELDSNTIS